MATRTLNRRARSSREAEPEDAYYDEEAEEQEPPRRGRARTSRSSRDEEPPRRSRSARSRQAEPEEEEERPNRSRGGRSSERPDTSKIVGRGWKSFKARKENTSSDYVKNFKLPEEASLIKILDDEPFADFDEHWLDELQGKKSFVCLGVDCPLCDIGDKPRTYAYFNILDLTDPDDPKVAPWKVSSTVSDVLWNYSQDKKTSPISREDLYWSIWKSGGGKKGRVQTNLNPVKARDLEEDWDVVPFTADELDEFDLFTEDDVLFINTRKQLQEIADDLD